MPVLVAVAVGLLVAPSVFAQADIEATSITIDPDPGVAGEYVDITITLTNTGPGPDPNPRADIEPMVTLQYDCVECGPNNGLFRGIQSYYIQAPSDETEWFVDIEDEDACTFFINNWGDTDAGDGIEWNDYYYMDCAVGIMTPDATAGYTLSVPLVAGKPLVSTMLEMNAPGDLAGETITHQPMLFGQPLNEWNFTGDIELVNDLSADPTYGCRPPSGFTPGNIALVDRGTCEFGEKAVFAESVGASAVLIANTTDVPDNDNDDRIWGNWGAGDFGAAATVPVLMIGWDDGQRLRAAGTNATLSAVFPEGDTWTFNVNGVVSEALNDPNAENDVLLVDVNAGLGGGQVAPTAAFTWSPMEPLVNQEVSFTDTSTGSPNMWAWNFGDGGTSSDQNPTHTFTTAGTFAVTLTASNATGSDMASNDVAVTQVAQDDEFYFSGAAARAAGAEGSFFVTDVDINNMGSMEMSYQFLWLPRNTDNATPTESAMFTLGAGMSVRYKDVLSEVFEADDAVGALAVKANSADALIMSRTFNQTDSGTFGQSIPGYHSDDLIAANTKVRVLYMTENEEFRSNLGLLNGTGMPVDIMYEKFESDGTSLGTETVSLPAWGNTQLNQLFADKQQVAGGYVDVWTETEGGLFTCYGSVLDNATSDPTTILPDIAGATTDMMYFVSAAAAAEGAEGSFFVTDLDVNNAGMAEMTYSFLWLPRNTDNAAPAASEDFTLAAGATMRYENILVDVFEATEDVVGALAVSADSSSALLMSRTFNQSDAGTFGQGIGGLSAGELVGANTKVRVLFMTENDDFRSNLGLLNGVGSPIEVMVEKFRSDGTSLGTQTESLAAWGNTQLNSLFSAEAPIEAAYVDVWTTTEGGMFTCYGSVLDNTTSDPTTVPPQ